MTGIPETVQQLIFLTIPTMDALEILVFLARHSEQHFTIQDLIERMRPTEIAKPLMEENLALLRSHGLVARRDDSVRYDPQAAALRDAVSTLLREYNERPVTLIRTIHDIADRKNIQSFADAFRLKDDRP